MRIYIVAPALPPSLDAIGAYTALLAAELARSAEVKILAAKGGPYTPVAGAEIVEAYSSSAPDSVYNLRHIVEADRPDWLLLQYNPFSYGRRGLNLALPQTLRRIKRQFPGTRIAVMAHETFMPPINLKFTVMSTWQRYQFWSLGRTADLLFFSIQYWMGRYAAWFPRTKLVHLPVGSNVPVVPLARAEARARLGIGDQTLVLPLFGTAHLSRMLDWIRDAADAIAATGQEILILYMGPDGPAVCEAFSGLPVLAEGPLTAEEVSRGFAAADMALTPFLDGVSTRRGSMMTGLQHGVATVGNRGAWSDPMLMEQDGKALLLADIRDPAGFRAQAVRLAGDAGLRREIGEGGRALYNREFAWPVISARVLQTMGALGGRT